MVNTAGGGGPVALFYQSLQLSEAGKQAAQGGKRAPRPPPKAAHPKQPPAPARGWVTAGNEAHNLPSLFQNVPPPRGAGAPAAAAKGKPARRRAPQAPPQTLPKRQSIGTLLCTARATPPSEHHGLLGGLARRAELLHVLKFLKLRDLAQVAAASWQMCAAARVVLHDRVQFRLATIQGLEESAARKDDGTLSMAEAEAMILCVRRTHIDEIRRMTRLPQPLLRLGEAVALCFSTKKAPPTWKDFVRLAQDPIVLAQKMTNFDKARITTKLMDKLRPFIEDDTLAEERIRAACEPARYVSRWLNGVYGMGAVLFRPWATDRAHAAQQGRAYLERAKPPPPATLPLPAAALAAEAASAGPLTTTDAFGSTLATYNALSPLPPRPQ